MKTISQKELFAYPNLKEYCRLSGKMKEIDEARKKVQEKAFIESEKLRKLNDLDLNEDLQLKAGKFNCIARVNITSKVYDLPKYLKIPFQKIEARFKMWKKRKDSYEKKNPNMLKKSNRNIRVTIS